MPKRGVSSLYFNSPPRFAWLFSIPSSRTSNGSFHHHVFAHFAKPTRRSRRVTLSTEPAQRSPRKPFPINHFRTLTHATEGGGYLPYARLKVLL